MKYLQRVTSAFTNMEVVEYEDTLTSNLAFRLPSVFC